MIPYQWDQYVKRVDDYIDEGKQQVKADSIKKVQAKTLTRKKPEPKNLSDGLVAFYIFGENAKDSSPNKNHGRVYGAKLTADRFGTPDNAYHFKSGQYIGMHNSPSFNSIRYGLTAMAWIKMDVYGGPHGIVSQDGKWTLFVHRGQLEAQVYFRDGTSIKAEQYGTMNLGTWYHVAMTYDGKVLRLWLNGNSIASVSAPKRTEIKKPKDFRLFSDPAIGHSVGTGESFVGSIDDVIIYDHPLNGTEIKALMGGEIPKFRTRPNT